MSERELVHRSLRAFSWLLGGTTGQMIVQLLALAVLARLVTPEEFGVVGAALVVIAFSKLFSEMGVGPALVQREILEAIHIRTGFTLSLVFGIILFLSTFAAAEFVAAFFAMKDLATVVRYLSVIFLLEAVSVVPMALLQRKLAFARISAINFVSYVVGYGVIGIVLAWNGWGVWALVAATVGRAAVRSLTSLIIQPHSKRPQCSGRAVSELLPFGSGLTVARVGNYIALQGDNIVVGRWLGAEALGIYGRAYSFVSRPANVLGSVVDSVLFPAMARVQGDTYRLGMGYLRIFAVACLISMVAAVGVILLAPELVAVLLGNQWSAAVLPAQILGAGIFFRVTHKVSDALIRARGAVFRRAWRQWVYGAMIVTGAVVGQQWGLEGVAAGIVLALCGDYLLMCHLACSVVSLSVRRAIYPQFRQLPIAMLFCLALWVFASIGRGVNFGPGLVVASSTAGVAVMGWAFYCWGGVILSAEARWMRQIVDDWLRGQKGRLDLNRPDPRGGEGALDLPIGM